MVIVASACAPVKGGPPRGVVLWGDSFGEQVAPLLPYEEHVFGGTAPCDWLNHMRELAATRPPAVALLLFGESTVTPCTGGSITTYPAQAFEAIRVLEAAGTRVFVIGAPCQPPHKGYEAPANIAFVNGGVPVHWGPYSSVCPPGYPTYIQYDGHLNATGVARFAHEIRVIAG